MRQVLSTAFVTLLLFFLGCKKTDMSAESDNSISTTTARTSSLVAVNQTCDVINFDNAGINSPMLLSSVQSAGGVTIPMTSYNSSSPEQPVAAMVFDSDAPHSEDLDLGTPSVLFGGPGQADNPNKSGLLTNNTALHNIVVIQNFIDYGTSVANDDDDRDGTNEYITFDFSSVGTITAKSITVIDVEVSEEAEAGWVILYDVNGVEINRYAFPETFEAGVAVINLGNTSGVRSIKLDIDGSIGFDNLAFCYTPPSNGSGCTYTQGYWKTHGPGNCAKGNNSNMWPQPIRSSGVTIGNYYYSPSAMCSLFNTPVKGTNLGLAHQLFAAMLNSAKNGGAPSSVQTCINNAITFLSNNGGATGTVSSNNLKMQREQLNTCLTNYNEGNHCK